jgi:alkylation response protein AidB-like acyl-CoA dehydrogenase
MSELLAVAERYLREEVAPRAEAIDADPEALRDALCGLGRRGLLALRRPARYGGPELGEEEFRAFQEMVARASGALAFLQTQHQSAAAMIARSENEELKRSTLPLMASGERGIGIGFSQLRREGPPPLVAVPVPGGYRLGGLVPWVTGWSFFDDFLVGAALPSGESVFGLAPLAGENGVEVGPPMALAAMGSALTVEVRFQDWLLPDDQVAFVRPPDWIHRNDLINITLQGYFALGCARAGLDVLLSASERRAAGFLREAWKALDAELGRCRQAMVAAQGASGEVTTDEKLRLRAWAIDLCARCAHAAVTASSGAANHLGHPAQRVYREALVFTVSAQTPAIMEATLARLVGRGQEPFQSTPAN